ncbi:MAG: hypothetical protein L0Y72_06555 [Gemmataceae bacterium]|nr:hypothetical protein [Gemmataceae bacterium]MCI0738687.1 hypothetical protein [Gemmataceae bacterium]
MNDLNPEAQNRIDSFLKLVDEGNLSAIRKAYPSTAETIPSTAETMTIDRAKACGMWVPILKRDVPKEFEDELAFCLARKWVVIRRDVVAGSPGSVSPDLIVLGDGGRERLALLRLIAGIQEPAKRAAVDWNEYRDERRPDGALLTVPYCEKRYNVSGIDLSLAAKKDRSIREKNPAGRGFVYLYAVVRDISDFKSRDD